MARVRVFQDRLTDFGRQQLAEGKEHFFCERIVPTTCTVLGYNVSAKNKIWTDLDWKHAWIDGKHGVRHMLDAGGSEYLHVSAAEECYYRVRPKLEIGDTVRVKGFDRDCEITMIHVDGMRDGFWQWRYTFKAK